MPRKDKPADSAYVWHGDYLQQVKVGDHVVHLKMTTETQAHLHVTTVSSKLMRSKVREIVWDGTSGFAELGAGMILTLEDGTVFRGDSENGFLGFYKITPNENKHKAQGD